MPNYCLTDNGGEATLRCRVRGHVVVAVTSYTDGSCRVDLAEPLTEMTYTGTSESRKAIMGWMTESALNPDTPFHYQAGFEVEPGRPGFVMRIGNRVVRDASGGFGLT